MNWDDVQAEIAANDAEDYRQTYGDTAADAAEALVPLRNAEARMEDICDAFRVAQDEHKDPSLIHVDENYKRRIIEDLEDAISRVKEIKTTA